ncbi:hypothetical protein GLX30_07330 [Streptomyces sp. Tu 2975]|uniref:hypothetical protein n=1 Tax=Streptomyces sp. Tu 2975 TaxID=2676871 RepID=UPI00135AAFB2|nr:hypothetical protein [Streptomyces sp. Tu 2975]QIP83903.1 hypothetical protein GLX30_07330 [Streptomyces sp. Tu 2975]
MAGKLTAVCLEEVGSRTAAAVDEEIEAALNRLGARLQDIGESDRVVVKADTFRRAPGLRACPELPAARASARGFEVLIAERTEVLQERLDALHGHREADVYLEGFPPQAIRTTGIRYSMGHDVQERTRFRVTTRLSDDSRPLSWSASEELV